MKVPSSVAAATAATTNAAVISSNTITSSSSSRRSSSKQAAAAAADPKASKGSCDNSASPLSGPIPPPMTAASEIVSHGELIGGLPNKRCMPPSHQQQQLLLPSGGRAIATARPDDDDIYSSSAHDSTTAAVNVPEIHHQAVHTAAMIPHDKPAANATANDSIRSGPGEGSSSRDVLRLNNPTSSLDEKALQVLRQ